MPRDSRRTKIEIVRELVEFLHQQEKPFFINKLKQLNMSHTSAQEWLELYELIHTGPKISRVEMDHNFLYKVIKEEDPTSQTKTPS